MANHEAQALSIEESETRASSLVFQAFHQRIRSLSRRTALHDLELQDIISTASSIKARGYLASPLSACVVLVVDAVVVVRERLEMFDVIQSIQNNR